MKKQQFLACSLALMVAAGTIGATTIEVNAQESKGQPAATYLPSEDSKQDCIFPSKDTQTPEYTGDVMISSMTISDLDIPGENQLLDTSAVVNGDNHTRWKIPVVWADENGNIITVNTSKVKAYPVFAFYVPQGYLLKDVETITGRITLPDSALKIYEGKKVVKIVDVKTGWVFITCIDGPGKNLVAQEAPAVFAEEVKRTGEIEKNKRNQAQNGVEVSDEKVVSTNNPDTSESSIDETVDNPTIPDEQKDETVDNPTIPDEQKDETVDNPQQPGKSEDEMLHLAQMYADDDIIDKYGVEKVVALVELIRDNVEPQIVNLYIDKIPCFGDAYNNGELSSQVGFYIFDEAEGAIACVGGGIDEDKMFRSIGLNAGQFSKEDTDFLYDENGEIIGVSDEKRNYLDNLLLHEMMHVFMADYMGVGTQGRRRNSETGELYLDNSAGFPGWFIEGTASVVANRYKDSRDTLVSSKYGGTTIDEKGLFDSDELKRAFYNNEEIRLHYCDESGEGGDSAYISGYLACVYLGYLASNNEEYRNKYGINGNAWTVDDDGKTTNIDNEVITQGMSAIFSEIHGHNEDGVWKNDSLDGVINKLLGSEGITSTADFEDSFIIGIEDSAPFCAGLLQYFEDNSSEERVNGSILLPADSTEESPLNENASVEAKAYKILDKDTLEEGNDGMTSDATNTFLDGGKSEP